MLGTSSSESVLPRMMAKMENLGVKKSVGRPGHPDRLFVQPRRHVDLPDDGGGVHRAGDQHADDADAAAHAARGAAADVEGRGRRHRQRLHRAGGDAVGGRPRAGRGPGADPRHRPLHVGGARADQPDRQRRRHGRRRQVVRRARHASGCSACSTTRPTTRPRSRKRCSTRREAHMPAAASEPICGAGNGRGSRTRFPWPTTGAPDARCTASSSSAAAPAGSSSRRARRHARQAQQGATITLIEKRAHAFLEAAPARDRRRQHGHRRLRDRLPRAVALALLPLPDRRDDRARPRSGARCTSRRSSTRTATRSRRSARSRYDTLVIAVGSLTNDFGTPGRAGIRDRARDAGRGRALPSPARQRVHPRARAGGAAAARAAARRDHRRRRDRRRARGGAAQHDAHAGVVRPRPHRSRQGHPARS